MNRIGHSGHPLLSQRVLNYFTFISTHLVSAASARQKKPSHCDGFNDYLEGWLEVNLRLEAVHPHLTWCKEGSAKLRRHDYLGNVFLVKDITCIGCHPPRV